MQETRGKQRKMHSIQRQAPCYIPAEKGIIMILEQHYLDCLSQASYLIGDKATGTAAVVDPRRDIDIYLEAAAQHGLTIKYALLTHFHADFLAGHLELRARTGADIVMGSKAAAGFPVRHLGHGETLSLGTVGIGCLETPGHTPESACFTVYETPGSDPKAVLTGDTLFIGGVGRPDLLVSTGVTAETLAAKLYDSLHDHLLKLPDSTLVYPGHGAGSACGKGISSETVSTIGDQKKLNFALSLSKEAFIADVTQGQPEAPFYFSYDAKRNQEARPTLSESMEQAATPLSISDVVSQVNRGAVVLDVREGSDFAAGHMSGSLNIALSGRYASWVGTMLPPTQNIILMADPGKEEEAAVRLGRIGYDNILGFVEGGPAAVPNDMQKSFKRYSASEVRAMPDSSDGPGSGDGPLIVDVRMDGEWADGHLSQAVHIPLSELESRMGELPKHREIVAQCRSGYRSMIAASMLERKGYRASDVEGGWLALSPETSPA